MVELERRSSSGVATEVQCFDQQGRLEKDFGRTADGREWSVTHKQAEQRSTGESLQQAERAAVHVEILGGLATWTMDGLHTVGFGTFEGVVAKTETDARGMPLETVFQNSLDEPVSRIRYVCDEGGRIREATQYAIGPDSGPLEYFKAAFDYDDTGTLRLWETWFGGQRVHRCELSYNGNADVAIAQMDEQQPVRFEYDYDRRGNWVRRVTRHSLGSDVETRRIVYVEE